MSAISAVIGNRSSAGRPDQQPLIVRFADECQSVGSAFCPAQASVGERLRPVAEVDQ
jgi:hypothetical protein